MLDTASDYLLEYVNDTKCNKWLGKVIRTFLQKDSEKKIYSLAEDLLGIKEYVVPADTAKTIDTGNDSVVIKQLIHKSGVNALAENQKIKFNSQVNVIYGLNGSGKSSYFRILNEMLGGENQTPIRPNIYRKDNEPVSVELKYLFRGAEKTAIWNAQSRGLKELKSLRVFDSAYTRDFLKKRNSDELVVKPYGLYLFADLITYVDQITQEAESIVEQKMTKKPTIDTKEMSADIAEIFSGEIFTSDELDILRKMFSDQTADEKVISSKKAEIDSLKLGDPKDKIALLNSQISEGQKISNQLLEKSKKVNEFIDSVLAHVKKYNELIKQSNIYKKKLEVLKDIPGTETDLWREFISKGIEYKENNLTEERCPFCHQNLSEHAKNIVDAYVLFLQDKSQIELGHVEMTLKQDLSTISSWNAIIETDKDKWEKEIYDNIESSSSTLNEIKIALLKIIENRTEDTLKKADFSSVILCINELVDGLKKSVSALSTDATTRAKTLRRMEDELASLKTILAVKRQQKNIEKIVSIDSWIKEKNEAISDVANQKKKISTLSKKAHNELLTDQLQAEFTDNLRRLNIAHIEIELLGKNSNGVQQTELTIRKNKDITTILSEGEQKATALALYLAEISLSKNKSTIIFDDPVNSLDHKMMQALADLLMEIENQIIVFTHNKMFLDCFECTKMGHICKGIDSACSSTKGKHIFLYETQSEGQNRKGVVLEKRVQTLSYYVREVERLLQEMPFTKYDEVGAKLRRAVETAVDEIVFNKQTPTKLSNKNSRIDWDALKKISNDATLIDGLKMIHGRVSGGELHNGSEREENPVDKECFEEMLNKLKSLCNMA